MVRVALRQRCRLLSTLWIVRARLWWAWCLDSAAVCCLHFGLNLHAHVHVLVFVKVEQHWHGTEKQQRLYPPYTISLALSLSHPLKRTRTRTRAASPTHKRTRQQKGPIQDGRRGAANTMMKLIGREHVTLDKMFDLLSVPPVLASDTIYTTVMRHDTNE